MENYSPKYPISICLIAKNEEDNLEPFYNSFRGILTHPEDEVVLLDTGSMDDTPKMAKELGMEVYVDVAFSSIDVARLGKKWKKELWQKYSKHNHFKKGVMADFAAARQQSFNFAKNDLCMWLDLDDEIVNAQLLRPIIDYSMDKKDPNKALSLFLRYDYSFDETGECDTVLWRERVVTKNDFHWKGKCHETLIPNEGVNYTMARDPNCPVVIKHRAPKQHEFSDLRNYIILRKDLEIDKNYDPRTLFYIGNACRGLKDHKEAIDWYMNFITRSGSKDDVMATRINCAFCYSQIGMSYSGIKQLLEAQLVDYCDPRVYYTMAAIWAELENWKNVITCVKMGDQFQLQDTMHAVDPKTLLFQPALALTRAYRELGDVDNTLRASERLLQSSKDPKIKTLVEDTRQWANAEKQTNIILSALRSAKNPEEALSNFKLSPHVLDKGIPIRETKNPGAGEGKKTIAFYCGQSATKWGPPSNEKGVGASEKMVYEAARRFVKQGYNVQVYCRLNREEGKCEEGIHWYYSGRYNPGLYRDVVIIWRVPQIVDKMNIECGKLHVWMHDVGNNREWTVPRLSKIDKVLFLSNFQRNLHPSVPDDKAYVTRNGIDLPSHMYNGKDKKKKIVFFSSPDRGWLTSIGMFNASKLHEKGYELHLFYGFGELWKELARDHDYGYIVEKAEDNRFYEYEDQCKMAANSTPGVIYRGRVGWKQMAEELQESEMWLYPTKFDEISCVAAMEAMASGLKIVATDHAALKETLKGYPGWFKVDLSDKKVDISPLIKAANQKGPSAHKLSNFAKKFDMDKLIEEWNRDLIKGKDDLRPNNDEAKGDGESRLSF